MKYTRFTTLLLGFVSVLIVLSTASCAIVTSQINHHMGANTQEVEPSEVVATSSPLAITNVNVLSPDGNSMLANQTVLITDGKITNIAEYSEVNATVRVIDGTDKYLIPGLIDSHTHLYKSKNDLLLYLANGVTHIANMSSRPDNTYIKWREEAENGALSPNIYIAAGGMTSKKGFMVSLKTYLGESPGYNTEQEARLGVQRYKAEGYDAIKAYNLNPEAFFAVNDEAKKNGLPVTGHLSGPLTMQNLYESGQDQLAHIEEIIKATLRDFGGLTDKNGDEYLSFLSDRVNNIAMKVKQNNITVVSTLWLMESLPEQRFNTSRFLKTIALEYQNPGIIEGSWFANGWLPGENRYQTDISNDDLNQLNKAKYASLVYVKAIHLVFQALVSNNVAILAGTDSNTAGTIAGFSLHDELESLRNAGMSNTQVLRSVTTAPATYMQSNSGKIIEGYDANLVLLAKNPLEDIRHTKTIQGVISNGKYLSRASLDKILNLVKQANNKSRKISIDEYLVE